MSVYDSFDSKATCEEYFSRDVDEVEYEEVMREMAEESKAQQGFNEWLDSLEPTERQAALEQAAFEQKEESRKDWFAGYSNRQTGEPYNGIAI